MVQITGGRIVYGRTVQPAQYESKKAEVELTFVLAEGEELEDKMNVVGQMCLDKAHEMVGLNPIKKVTVAPKQESKVVNPTTRAPIAPKEEPKQKTKAEIEAEAMAEAEKETKETRQKPKVKKPPAPPAEDDFDLDEKPTEEQADDTSTADEPAKEADPLDFEAEETFEAEESDVTDQQLMDALTKKNGAFRAAGNPGGTQAIRKLIGKYVAPPGQAREIPVDKRRGFLLELEALK